MLVQSATDILTVLQTPPPSLIPKLHYGDDVKNAIDHLARLLQRAVQRTKPSQHKLSSTPALGTPPSLPPSLPRVVPPAPPRVQHPSITPAPPRPPAPIAAAAAHVSKSVPTLPLTFACPDPSNRQNEALNILIAQNLFTTPVVNHIYNEQTGKRETMDTLLAEKNPPFGKPP